MDPNRPPPLDRRTLRAVLVADDDPSTRQFLSGALVSLGYDVTLAVDGKDALRHACATKFDALVLDCRMPHGGAMDILRDLREGIDAASAGAPAFATSAEIPGTLRDDLADAGFAGVIEKPCKISALKHALEAVLGVDPRVDVLDDKEGLTATGDAAIMRTLRELLHRELLDLRSELHTLAHDPAGLVDRLHRLRSACGFCGATRLGAQAKALQGHVVDARYMAPAVIERFRRELEATITALAL
ncbi:response regulator [Luteibacter aegosomatissinici]|uniref:response regulator n=1 Tax=Luteibacter aegosomatissinici TaxID=2911539 RepID=UPI001FFA50F3|nr:response regulator [Luteibacter aegosomatissinici]UPG96263.1 response regulator [Luteibacter aegosomatissinici]